MTKNEYLAAFKSELRKNGVADAEDILEEYAQHFAFKMADGIPEDEIAAKLGAPEALAAQFDAAVRPETSGGRKFATGLGLGFSHIFTGMFFILLWAWEVVMAVFALACGVLSVCLIGGLNIYGLIPPMPWGCAAVFALACAALAVLTAAGCDYFAAFSTQLMRAYGRFARNTMAAAGGRPVLPPLPLHPQLPVRRRRRVRGVALVSLCAFAVLFVASLIVAMLSAQAIEFWHAWNWFV